MIKVQVFIGTSLDGFIARQDGDISWLDSANKKATPGEDFGFNSFLKSVDLIVMGRKTFEQDITFNDWSYKDTKMIVLTSREIKIPERLKKTVTISNTISSAQLIKELSDQPIYHRYVDGGTVIQDFLSTGLVDEITVTIVPIHRGNG